MLETLLLVGGQPASGKGTAIGGISPTAEQLEAGVVQHPAFVGMKIHILGCGEVFREFIRANSLEARLAKAFMAEGRYVPDHIVFPLFITSLKRQWDEIKNADLLILDGMPRTKGQVTKCLHTLIKSTTPSQVKCFMNIGISHELLNGRRLQRIAEAKKKGEEPRADDLNARGFYTRLAEFDRSYPDLRRTLRDQAYCGRRNFHEMTVTHMKKDVDEVLRRLGYPMPQEEGQEDISALSRSSLAEAASGMVLSLK